MLWSYLRSHRGKPTSESLLPYRDFCVPRPHDAAATPMTNGTDEPYAFQTVDLVCTLYVGYSEVHEC